MAKWSKIISILRDGMISLAIAGLLFFVFEEMIRFVASQKLKTVYVGEQSLGMRDSLLGHLNRPNAHALVEGPEFSVEYKINELGFRDASAYTPTKPDGVTRILLLGDSFTFGSGNHYDDIWPVALERRLRETGHKVEVIKAGVSAYDTRTEVLYLERLYEQYYPDIVVIAFLPNDLFTNTPISQSDSLNGAEASNPASPPNELNTAVLTVSDKKSDLHLLLLAKRLLMSNDEIYTRLYLMTGRRAFFSVPLNDLAKRQIRVTGTLFSRAQNFCQRNGCEFIVLSIPQQFQVLAEANQIKIDGIELAHFDTEFSQLAADEGFKWIPLLPELAEVYATRGEDLYYRYDGHLNFAGNQAVAAFVADIFLEQLEEDGLTENKASLSGQ